MALVVIKCYQCFQHHLQIRGARKLRVKPRGILFSYHHTLPGYLSRFPKILDGFEIFVG